MKQVLSVLALLFVSQVFCSPLPHGKHQRDSNERQKVLFDQRQEGAWNVRADLKNFVILIIPENSPKEPSASSSMLDLFRSHSKRRGYNQAKNAQKQAYVDTVDSNEVGAETLHFIESKTAPYHVDIGKSDSHLLNDEILATRTPPVALALKKTEEIVKNSEDQADKTKVTIPALLRQLRSTRFAKAIVLTVPEDDFVLTKMEESKKVVKKDGLKNKLKKVNKEEDMMLLGASEQCGPEMVRDIKGVCRLSQLSASESKESLERDE